MKNAMKIVLVGVMALFCVNEAMAGTFRDPRDGKTYKTVKMPDGNIWMAENLNYNMNGSVCYDNDASNCSKYGRLYTWEAAKKACPSGWHLPSGGEFRNLLGAVGGDEPKKLRARSWVSEEQVCEQYGCSYGNGSTIRECRGNNRCNCGQGESICMEYGVKEVRGEGTFSALPAGRYYSSKEFSYLGSYAYFWSSTEYNDRGAYYLFINESLAYVDGFVKTLGYSVRCLQDTEAWIAKKRAEEEKKRVEEEEKKRVEEKKKRVEEEKKRAEEEKKRAVMGSFKDPRDGKKYKTVKIGDQTWMAENLNYSIDGSMCYDNDASNCSKYGRLYTWEAAKKACPSGWRLPKNKDIEKMLAVVGADSRERSLHLRTEHEWIYEKADDAYYFSALPAGRYDVYEYYNGLGKAAFFWSSTEYDRDRVYYYLRIRDYDAYISYSEVDAVSIRCLQDSNDGVVVSSSRSQTRSLDASTSRAPSEKSNTKVMTDSRDGKTYKTVKIGMQTWMAENLNYKMEDSYCNPENNCGDGYGRLYTWDAALNACPSGWRLPSKTDFEKLLAFVKGLDAYGDGESAARHLRSKYDWTEVGDDASGFSVLPAGGCTGDGKKFGSLGYGANFWSSTEDDSDFVYSLSVLDGAANFNDFNKTSGISVRCLQD